MVPWQRLISRNAAGRPASHGAVRGGGVWGALPGSNVDADPSGAHRGGRAAALGAQHALCDKLPVGFPWDACHCAQESASWAQWPPAVVGVRAPRPPRGRPSFMLPASRVTEPPTHAGARAAPEPGRTPRPLKGIRGVAASTEQRPQGWALGLCACEQQKAQCREGESTTPDRSVAAEEGAAKQRARGRPAGMVTQGAPRLRCKRAAGGARAPPGPATIGPGRAPPSREAAAARRAAAAAHARAHGRSARRAAAAAHARAHGRPMCARQPAGRVGSVQTRAGASAPRAAALRAGAGAPRTRCRWAGGGAPVPFSPAPHHIARRPARRRCRTAPAAHAPQIEAKPPDAAWRRTWFATSQPPRPAVSRAPAPTAAASARTNADGRRERCTSAAIARKPALEPAAAQAAKAAAYEEMRRPSIM
jgi:hypothetical protein